ncbi:MAG: terminase large subunit domain-containing protein [Polyangiales bacterium]
MTLITAKKNEDDLARWIHTEAGFITALCRYEGKPIVLDPYQQDFLNERSRFRCVTKSRQVGFSFLMALEALARCHLRDGYTAVFVSFSLDEAKERIQVARHAYEELAAPYKKKLVVDSKTELAFESNSPGKSLSRMLSLPSKAPRGKGGDNYNDEFAHNPNDREVYKGSTALILRSNGQLTVCSTPLGRRGMFWEIAREEMRKYPQYSRQEVPWWLCRFFSKDPRLAAIEAPYMSTEDRVARFGRRTIVEQFEALALEDFQQELEATFVDESYSYYPYDLILPNTSDDVRLAADVTDIPPPRGRLVAGFDVGRVRDRSELAVFEEHDGHFTCRHLRSYAEAPFAEQEADLRRLLEVLPVARLSIDRSGIGMNLAEVLTRDYPQVVAENFTNDTKERWATDFKILLQRREVALPRDRDLVAQVHSIKKRVLGSGKVAFDAERTARTGHADRFWAIAMACQKERAGRGGQPVEIRVRILG